MFLRLSNHIRICFYNEHIIILDLREDEYVVLDTSFKKMFLEIFSTKFVCNNGRYMRKIHPSCMNENEFHSFITDLEKSGIISKELFEEPQKEILTYSSCGMPSINWEMDRSSLDRPTRLKIFLEAYRTLVYVFLLIKLFGINKLVTSIKQKVNPTSSYSVVSNKNYLPLVDSLNQACFYYPVKVKCLEWSVALCIMALRRKWKCSLVIGVQNMPFFAHAWVRTPEGIVADDPLLDNRMAKILQEPFNFS